MKNRITIILDDAKGCSIDFAGTPTLSELIAGYITLEEVIEHNYSKGAILKAKGNVYDRIINIEEIRRTQTNA